MEPPIAPPRTAAETPLLLEELLFDPELLLEFEPEFEPKLEPPVGDEEDPLFMPLGEEGADEPAALGYCGFATMKLAQSSLLRL